MSEGGYPHQDDPDLTMFGVFSPRYRHGFGRGVTIPSADPNPGGLAAGTRSRLRGYVRITLTLPNGYYAGIASL